MNTENEDRLAELKARLNQAEDCLSEIRALMPKGSEGIELVKCVFDLRTAASRLSKLREELEETKSGWCLQVERAEKAERELAEARRLHLDVKEDGMWLRVTAPSGLRASVNLGHRSIGIVSQALRECAALDAAKGGAK